MSTGSRQRTASKAAADYWHSARTCSIAATRGAQKQNQRQISLNGSGSIAVSRTVFVIKALPQEVEVVWCRCVDALIWGDSAKPSRLRDKAQKAVM